jgi:hypothetical protein
VLIRKIADLEISNASLMAINRTLEATKEKQRLELLKLRRALRTSLAGGSTLSSTLMPTSNSQPLLSPTGSLGFNLDFEEEEVLDPETESRWEKMSELVKVMRKRGEDAVVRGREEVKVGGQRVLGWMEVEGHVKEGDEGETEVDLSSTRAATPEAEVSRVDDEL